MKKTIIGVIVGIVLVVGGVFIYNSVKDDIKTTQYALQSNESIITEYHNKVTMNGVNKALDLYYILDKTYVDKNDVRINNLERGKYYSVKLVVYLNGVELKNDDIYTYGTSNDESWVFNEQKDISDFKENILVNYDLNNYGVIKSENNIEYLYYYTYVPYELGIEGGLYIFDEDGSFINKILNYSITDDNFREIKYDNGYVIKVENDSIYYYGFNINDNYWKEYKSTIKDNKLNTVLNSNNKYICTGACSKNINIFE